jgi:predicted ATPase
MRTARRTIETAQTSNHTISMCYTLTRAACPVALWVGDLAKAEHYVAMLLDYAAKLGMAVWLAEGRCFKGILVIRRGSVGTRLRFLRTALDELRETGSALRYTAYLGVMAEGLAGAGRIAEGFAAVNEAIERSENNEERWCISELLRITGELILLENGPDAAPAAEGHFRQALNWAQRQGALSWELRAATSLARLWRDQHRTKKARELLA